MALPVLPSKRGSKDPFLPFFSNLNQKTDLLTFFANPSLEEDNKGGQEAAQLGCWTIYSGVCNVEGRQSTLFCLVMDQIRTAKS